MENSTKIKLNFHYVKWKAIKTNLLGKKQCECILERKTSVSLLHMLCNAVFSLQFLHFSNSLGTKLDGKHSESIAMQSRSIFIFLCFVFFLSQMLKFDCSKAREYDDGIKMLKIEMHLKSKKHSNKSVWFDLIKNILWFYLFWRSSDCGHKKDKQCFSLAHIMIFFVMDENIDFYRDWPDLIPNAMRFTLFKGKHMEPSFRSLLYGLNA